MPLGALPPWNIPADSVVIATLLLDLCPQPPFGGYRRARETLVRILEDVCHLPLTGEEREAILLHMHKEALFLKGTSLSRLVWLANKTSAAGCVPLRDSSAA